MISALVAKQIKKAKCDFVGPFPQMRKHVLIGPQESTPHFWNAFCGSSRSSGNDPIRRAKSLAFTDQYSRRIRETSALAPAGQFRRCKCQT